MDFIDDDPQWPYSKAKTAVIRAAAAVIRESGPRSATLKNIAQRAGITEPAIFRHFEGVDGLFEGLFFVFERMLGRIGSSFAGEEKGLARASAAAESILALVGQNRDFAYLVLHAEHIFRGYDDLRRRLADLRKSDQYSALSAFEEAAALGELRADVTPRMAALTMMSTFYFTIQGWVDSDAEFDIRALALGRIKDIFTILRRS